MENPERPLPGRLAEAKRNDTTILLAARRVFLRDPAAPMAAVATEAGVGMSALYKRYAGKEDLLRTLCTNGLERFAEIAREAQSLDDPWESLASFVTGVVESDVHSLTVKLGGTFSPTPAMRQLAIDVGQQGAAIFERAQAAGVVRPGLSSNDLVMVFEQLSAVRLGDDDRTLQLRRRYLALHLDSLRHPGAGPPGEPPTGAELGARWAG